MRIDDKDKTRWMRDNLAEIRTKRGDVNIDYECATAESGPSRQTMGLTTYSYPVKITLFSRTFKMPEFCVKGVLWHEYCHYYLYKLHDKSMGHGAEFKRMLRSEPRLYLGDVLAGFLYAFY